MATGMARLVPANVRSMLDVGCGPGDFAKRVQSALNAEVWGIEPRPDHAETARGVLFKVIEGNYQSALPNLPEGYFDLVVFHGALERCVDPEALLRSALPLLTNNGAILISILNFRHWRHFEHLLWRGEFEYVSEGPLDRANLRFFTQKSIKGLFKRAGYVVAAVEGLNPSWTRSLRVLNALTFNRFADCRFAKFAVLARPLENL